MTIHKKIIFPFFILLCLQSITFGQDATHQDPLNRFFFSPELIMQNQHKIGLSPAQKEKIIVLVGEGQKEFTRLQWNIQAEMEAMQSIIKESKVDDAEAIAQLDKVLEVERKIKRTQIVLFVQIKNLLSAEQQQILMELKNQK